MTNAPPQRWQSLQSAARRARITYTKLAALADTSRQSISAYARGTRRPSDEMIDRLAAILNVPADQLRVDVPSATTSLEERFNEIDGLVLVLDSRLKEAANAVEAVRAKRDELQQLVQVPA